MSHPGGPGQGSASEWNQQGWGSATPQPSANPPQQGWGQQDWNQNGQQGWNQPQQGYGQPSATEQQWGQQPWGQGNAQSQPSADQGAWGTPSQQYPTQQFAGQDGQGQQPWGQQDAYAGQGYGQNQQWGQQQPQGSQWANTFGAENGATSTAKKGINPIIPIVVALAVLIGGVGIWALTRGGDDGDGGGSAGGGTSQGTGTGGGGKVEKGSAADSVQNFFRLLNVQDPNSTEFDKYVTEVGMTGIYEAVSNAPGGKYEVKEIGAESNGKIPVTFTHQGQTIKGEFGTKKDGDITKLLQPFASLTVSGSEDSMSFSITDEGTQEYGARKELYYPGVYTVKPLAGYSQQTVNWTPKEKTFVAKPGESRTIKIVGEPTKEWKAEVLEAYKKSMNECLAKDDFFLYDCPFEAKQPTDADWPANVEYKLSPANAADNATHVPGTAVNPCFVTKADFSYQYSTQGGDRKSSTPESKSMKGCYDSILQRIRWNK